MKVFLKIIGLLVIIASFYLYSTSIFAAKPRLSRGGGTGATVAGGKVKSSVKFKTNRLGLVLSLSGLTSAKSVSYQLTYTADGVPQGVMGTIKPSTDKETREILFGTCSAGVCRYHNNITNARLVITSKLKSGLTINKPYRIKV